MRMARRGGVMPQNHSYMNIITNREFVAISLSHLSLLDDKLSFKLCVMVVIQRQA